MRPDIGVDSNALSGLVRSNDRLPAGKLEQAVTRRLWRFAARDEVSWIPGRVGLIMRLLL
jgi:hypothetical protein